ncbi:MAG: DUF5723 family protein [Luteibaculaceae bacterium]
MNKKLVIMVNKENGVVRSNYVSIKFLLVCVSILFSASKVHAQKDFTLYNMPGVFQSTYVNPALQPDAAVHVGLPLLSGFMMAGSNSGFNLNHIRPRVANGEVTFERNRLQSVLNPINFLTFDAQFELFSLGFYAKKNYISFSASERFHGQIIYPGDMPRLVIEGNGDAFLGNRANLDGFKINTTAFREFAFGFSREANEKLTLGVRAKVLMGHFNIVTEETRFGVFTNPDNLDITIDGGGRINASGITSISDETAEFTNDFLRPKNLGFAFDFGATYKATEKITVTASLLDLGAITWTQDARNYIIEDFNFTIDNATLLDLVNNRDETFDRIIDSLSANFQEVETRNRYTSGLYTRFFVGANYEVNKVFSTGALIYNEFIQNNLRQAYSFNGTFKIKEKFTITAHYTTFSRSYNNVGLGFAARLGGVQLYLITDNINVLTIPSRTRNVHFRGGMNLVFGKKPERDTVN